MHVHLFLKVEYQVKEGEVGSNDVTAILFSPNSAFIQQCPLTFHMLCFYFDHPSSSQKVTHFLGVKEDFQINQLLCIKIF